jgi:hypothetical protein
VRAGLFFLAGRFPGLPTAAAVCGVDGQTLR